MNSVQTSSAAAVQQLIDTDTCDRAPSGSQCERWPASTIPDDGLLPCLHGDLSLGVPAKLAHLTRRLNHAVAWNQVPDVVLG
jgi:hypothetical protein